MNAQSPPPRRDGLFGRPILTVTIVLAALLGAGLAGAALADRDSSPAVAPARTTPAPAASPTPESGSKPEPAEITLSATGDIIMGGAPARLPANGGRGFFDRVRPALAADLVMGNLEQTLTGDTGSSKCGRPARKNCFAFRTPPEYAEHLADAGFDLLNTANNHSSDFGPQGYRNTVQALEAAGLRHTGARDEITVVDVRGVRVGVLGFSPYSGANDLNDLDAARSVVRKAKAQADLVVVQAHLGAEGADRTHVRPGSEIVYGENRGDPVRFSRAVIDAGADLVVGHGPHVLRGMEFYRGKLIAYSLGNFAGGGKTLASTGILKYSGVLHVTLGSDGSYRGGKFVSTYVGPDGLPRPDAPADRGRKLVAELSAADFGERAARFSAEGTISTG